MNRALVAVVGAARQKNNLAVVQLELAILQRTVRLYFNRGVRSFNCAQITGIFFSRRLNPSPGRIVIGNTDVLNGWQIHHAHSKARRDERPGGYVVFDVLRQAGEDELVGRPCAGVRFGLHCSGLPNVGALIPREESRLARPQAGHVRSDQLIAVPPYGDVTRSHCDGIERSSVPVCPKQ